MAENKVDICDKGSRLYVRRGGGILIDSDGKITGPDDRQADAIADPTGGSTEDAECRAAVADILAALRRVGIIAS